MRRCGALVRSLQFVEDLEEVGEADLRDIRAVEVVERFGFWRRRFERIECHVHRRCGARGDGGLGEVVGARVGRRVRVEMRMPGVLRLVEEGRDQLFRVVGAWLAVAVRHGVDDATVLDSRRT